jgi:hypothetical protein
VVEAKRRILTSYFLDYSLGGLNRENLLRNVPLPVLLTLIDCNHSSETTAIISGTVRIDNTDLVTVYSPTYMGDHGMGEGLYVGRTAGFELTLKDAEISRQHAIIQKIGPNWFISDLGSRNGTASFDIHTSKRVAVPRYPAKQSLETSAFLTFGGSWYRFFTPERFFAQIKRKSVEYKKRLSSETSDGL